MSTFTNRGRYEDYTMDDDINSYDSYDDEDEEDISFSASIKKWFGAVKERIAQKKLFDDEEDEAESEDSYDDGYSGYYDEPRVKEKGSRAGSRSGVKSRQSASGNTAKGFNLSDEDLENYDKKYGTYGSSARARQDRVIKERFGFGSARREESKVTKVPEWEKYKGSVKNILEVEPKSMDEVGEIARQLQNEYAAIVSIKAMRDQRQRVVDFLDGAAFVLDYRFECIGDNYYICAPKGYMRRYELGKKFEKR